MNQNKEIAEDDNDNDAAATSSSTYLHTADIASFMDLQTEFIQRRDAALTTKQNAYSQDPANYVHKTKNNILAISKEEKRSKEELAIRRTNRIKENEELMRKEQKQVERQKQIMEQKAAIYEQMSRGQKLVYEDGKEAEFLVDFHTKKRELEMQQGSSRNNGDSTDDELKRSDDERQKRREQEKATPLIIHYDPTEEKGRVFGASHVPLPTMNEDAREKKIAELKSMTDETNRERLKRKKQRDAQKAEERRRVNRIRKRMGLPPEESSEEEEIEEEKTEESQTKVEDLPSSRKDEEEPEEKKPRKYGVRDWDRGKIGYTRWIEAQREERDEEFAPPKFYHKNEKKYK